MGRAQWCIDTPVYHDAGSPVFQQNNRQTIKEHGILVWLFKEQLTNSLKVTEKRGRNHFLVKLHVLHRFAFVASLPEIISVSF